MNVVETAFYKSLKFSFKIIALNKNADQGVIDDLQRARDSIKKMVHMQSSLYVCYK